MRTIWRKLVSREGQTLVEYALILVIVVIVIIASLAVIAQKTTVSMDSAANQLP